MDLWLVDLESVSEAVEILDSVEIRRGERLLVEAKRKQFLRARTALRRVLAPYVQQDAADIRFTLGDHGKPWLRDRNWVFNLSHSGERAVVAVAAADIALGADVELCTRARSVDRLIDRFFSPVEAAQLRAFDDQERCLAFYRGWTCKEAYLKAWGTGLSFPSRRFSVDLGFSLPQVELVATEMPEDDGRGWVFRDGPWEEDYWVSLCWRGPESHVRVFRYEEEVAC